MAAEAAHRLDDVERIAIKDYALTEGEGYVPLWIPSVYAIDCATEPYVWEDGAPKRVPIFSGEEIYDFPPPLGVKGKLYLHAHEEPVTIPLHLGRPVRHCDYKIGEPDIDAWRFMVERLRLMDERKVRVRGGGEVSPRELLLAMLPPTPSPQRLAQLVREGRLTSRSMLVVEVTGTRDGRPTRLQSYTEAPDLAESGRIVPGSSDISLVTSAPAAVFSLMILRGEIAGRGVILPESLSHAERDALKMGIAECDIHIRLRELA
jgi:saccharopine dehydrogenase-like NADP-dependent oxidoreductase